MIKRLDYTHRGLAEAELDADALEGQLKRWVKGEVRFDNGSRALYATDGSNYRQVPIGVVIPKDAEDVMQAMAACREAGAPLLGRGGGTSLAGQCCNVAVVLDFSKYMHEVIDINPDKRVARVQPGAVLDRLNVGAGKHDLVFAPDPATHDHCTLGGMIGNNSCGIHSIMAGRVADNVEDLEIVTYDGLYMKVGATGEDELKSILSEGGRRAEIYRRLLGLRDRYADEIRARFPDIPRRVSGFNLDELLPEKGFNLARALVGTESSCAITIEATLNLVHSPPARSLLVLGFEDVYSAADHVTEIMTAQPIGLEGIDDRLVEDLKKKGLHTSDLEYLPDGNGWLLVEFGGEARDESDDRAREVMKMMREHAVDMKLYDDEQREQRVWEIRESGLGATAFIPDADPTWEGWEDSAVPPEAMGDYLRALRKLYDRYEYFGSFYGHFGEGCLHTRINFDLRTAPGIEKFRSFLNDAADLCLSFGGSLSGEHGDGQSRAEMLEKMFGTALVDAFREFKSIWDPAGRMNPGKVVDPYRITENLRLGTDFNPPVPETHFAFTHEGGSFVDAAMRCVGVGACRREGGGTMCPSYMVTREEMHSTRGRARLLFEMLQGPPLEDGWREDPVHDALELCLACKGCKSDCPVDVDMATYKSEFYSHYYKRRLRPRAAYSMGLIHLWARVASRIPRIANFLTHAPLLGSTLKKLGGIATQREAPVFADESFTSWFAGREAGNSDADRVILWPDTFNNYFHPEVAKAAVEVLEHIGYRVEVPNRRLCCGRPLYDYGMLPTAKRLLHETLEALRDDIRRGTPIVGLEPSCVAVFRDELTNLFPKDEDANRLQQRFFTFAEFLDQTGWEPPRLERNVIVHGHCHHAAIMGLDPDRKLLDRMNARYEMLDSGCCGLAGSFGFEAGDKYEVSVKAGERALLPSVRAAGDRTIVMTDGFSCKTQIDELTDRRALHLAQVVQMALRDGPGGADSDRPEDDYPDRRARGRP
jgi:FAD/FMN-containing dehydrogenase/Fe-S oxidoreductase